MADLVRIDPETFKRLKGTALPPLAHITHTGLTEFSSACYPLWEQVSAAQKLPFPGTGAILYHSVDGKFIYIQAADRETPGTVAVNIGKRHHRLALDLGPVLAKFNVPPGFDFRFVAPVQLRDHPDVGQCLALEMGDALRRHVKRVRKGKGRTGREAAPAPSKQ